MNTEPRNKIHEAPQQAQESKPNPIEKARNRCDVAIAKYQSDIEESQKENEILFDLAEQIPQKSEAPPEQVSNFLTRLSSLKRFSSGKGNPEVFLTSLLRENKQGKLIFGQQINVNQGYIEGYEKEIAREKKELQEFLDEMYKV